MKNLIVDGSNAAAASFFVIRKDYPSDKDIIEAELEIDSNEIVEKVVSNFNAMISGMETLFQTDNVYIAWEGKDGTKWRKEILPEYKANRGEKPLFMIECLNACRQQNLYPNFSIDNAEGDDTVYALCKHFHEKGDENIIVSSDRDFISLAQRGYAKGIYDFPRKTFREIPKHDLVLEKAIVGDKSDNILGIRGIGPKKFEKLKENNFKDLSSDDKLLVKKLMTIIDLEKNPHCETIFSEVVKKLGE